MRVDIIEDVSDIIDQYRAARAARYPDATGAKAKRKKPGDGGAADAKKSAAKPIRFRDVSKTIEIRRDRVTYAEMVAAYFDDPFTGYDLSKTPPDPAGMKIFVDGMKLGDIWDSIVEPRDDSYDIVIEYPLSDADAYDCVYLYMARHGIAPDDTSPISIDKVSDLIEARQILFVENENADPEMAPAVAFYNFSSYYQWISTRKKDPATRKAIPVGTINTMDSAHLFPRLIFMDGGGVEYTHGLLGIPGGYTIRQKMTLYGSLSTVRAAAKRASVKEILQMISRGHGGNLEVLPRGSDVFFGYELPRFLREKTLRDIDTAARILRRSTNYAAIVKMPRYWRFPESGVPEFEGPYAAYVLDWLPFDNALSRMVLNDFNSPGATFIYHNVPGRTFMHVLCMRSQILADLVRMVQFFIKDGVPPSQADANGMTPLDVIADDNRQLWEPALIKMGLTHSPLYSLHKILNSRRINAQADIISKGLWTKENMLAAYNGTRAIDVVLDRYRRKVQTGSTRIFLNMAIRLGVVDPDTLKVKGE